MRNYIRLIVLIAVGTVISIGSAQIEHGLPQPGLQDAQVQSEAALIQLGNTSSHFEPKQRFRRAPCWFKHHRRSATTQSMTTTTSASSIQTTTEGRRRRRKRQTNNIEGDDYRDDENDYENGELAPTDYYKPEPKLKQIWNKFLDTFRNAFKKMFDMILGRNHKQSEDNNGNENNNNEVRNE